MSRKSSSKSDESTVAAAPPASAHTHVPRPSVATHSVFLRPLSGLNTMNAHGVLSAKPVAASAQRVGRRSMAGLGKNAGASHFYGNSKALKARATMGRRVAQPMGLHVRAEKVVGIDLGTTNSAVRIRAKHSFHLPGLVAHPSRRRFLSPPQPWAQGLIGRG